MGGEPGIHCAVLAPSLRGHGWYCTVVHMYVSRLDIKSCEMRLQVASLLSTFAVGGLFFFFFFQHARSRQQASPRVVPGTLSVLRGHVARLDGRQKSECREYRVHDSLRQRVRGGAPGGMLACWGHVQSMPMLMPACTGGQRCRRAGVQAVQRTNDSLDATRLTGVEGPERVEVEQSTLSGRELSADWRSGPAGEHLVCREVGTGCQSPCKAAFLITSTGVLQRLRVQGCPGSLISLGLPFRAFPRPLNATLPYQPTRPLFPSLIDPLSRLLARSVTSLSINPSKLINQPLSALALVLPMPRLDHSLLRVPPPPPPPSPPRSSPFLPNPCAHPLRSLPNLGAD